MNPDRRVIISTDSHISDPRHQTNDEFGYAVYSVWVYATADQIADIAELRHEISWTRNVLPAYIRAKAHVTVKALCSGIGSLELMASAVKSVASSSSPFEIQFQKHLAEWGDGNHTCAKPVEVSQELKSLNRKLESAVRPLTQKTFGGRNFKPHMTIYQDANQIEVRSGKELAKGLKLGRGFQVNTLELVGRVGPFATGQWKSLGSFLLKG